MKQADGSGRQAVVRHCICQPWLTMSDCPVNASEGNAAKKTATSAMSSAVVNSPSTVSAEHDRLDDLFLGQAQFPGLLGDLPIDEGRANEAGADHVGPDTVNSPFLGDQPANPIRPCLAVT